MADTVLITGATRGIGRATARCFAAAGYTVWAVARTEADLLAMREEWRQAFPTSAVRTYAVDLATDTGRTKLDTYLTQLPPPDVIVCNAGLFRPGRLLDRNDQLPGLMDLNYWAPYYLARRLLPRMIERGSGHWLTVGSVATRDDTAGTGPYAVSKYALEGLHRSLAHETRGTGVRFTLLVPGATYTSSWQDEESLPERILSAEEVGQAILASALNPGMNEVVIRP